MKMLTLPLAAAQVNEAVLSREGSVRTSPDRPEEAEAQEGAGARARSAARPSARPPARLPACLPACLSAPCIPYLGWAAPAVRRVLRI